MFSITEYLCKRSGEDLFVINNCGHRGIKNRFAAVGLFASLVALISFLSCWYSFQMLFDSSWMAIPVAIFFGWMIYNIYEVLLTTLSKPVLKIKYQGVIKHLSFTLRIGFVIFFAVFISKPLEAWMFEPQLLGKVELLKKAEINKAEKQLHDRTAWEEKKLLDEIHHKRAAKYSDAAIKPIQNELDQLYSDREEALERVKFVVGKADYFIQRLQILTSSGLFTLSWLVTSLIVILFLAPAYLKWKINMSNQYFVDKKAFYERIVLDGYKDFKDQYELIFKEQYKLDIHYYESYLDPPFNTQRIIHRHSLGNQEDFIKQLYS